MAEVVDPIELHTRPALIMDDEQFYHFCRLNRVHRIERTAEGNLVIMSPEAGSSGSGSIRLGRFFDEWAEEDGTGRVFGSSTGFVLPNHAVRSPDVSWVLNSRLKALSGKDWNRFLPLCPDFVLELLSPSDRLAPVQAKMEEYIANGARLGWILDPTTKNVHIYRPNTAPEILAKPADVTGDPVLPKFRLQLSRVWKVMEL